MTMTTNYNRTRWPYEPKVLTDEQIEAAHASTKVGSDTDGATDHTSHDATGIVRAAIAGLLVWAAWAFVAILNN